MNTKISEQIRRLAMELYLTGVPIEEIARRLGLHRNSIQKWKKTGKWESRKERVNKNVEKNVEDMAKEVFERLLRLSKAIQGKFVQTLDLQEIKASDAIRAMELEAKLLGLFDPPRAEAHTSYGLAVRDIIEIAQEEMNGDKKNKRELEEDEINES